MGFATNYNDIFDGQLMKPGEYEVVIQEMQEKQAATSGKVYLSLVLVVRNDVEQQYKNKLIFHAFWKLREPTQSDVMVQGYSFSRIMGLAKAANLPSGKNYDTLQDFCNDLIGRTVRVTMNIEQYNGESRENVKYINSSKFPECHHIPKEKNNVTDSTVAPPKNEHFANIQAQPIEMGNLSDFEEIITSEDVVPF